MQNTLDWRQMSALAPASCVGLAGGHLSGRTDGRTSGDKEGEMKWHRELPRAGPGIYPPLPRAMGSSPNRWKRPREQKGSPHARVLSLCSHCGPTAGAPLIFSISPKGQVAEFPSPLGEAKGVWAEGKENSQATTRVSPCPGPAASLVLPPLCSSVSPSVQRGTGIRPGGQ